MRESEKMNEGFGEENENRRRNDETDIRCGEEG